MASNVMVLGGFSEPVMSSREISELTGKRHDNVMADIRKMLDDLGLHSPDFSGQYKDSTGRSLSMFNLPKRETLILVSGYDTVLRARVIDKLNALEQQLRGPQMPKLELAKQSVEAVLGVATLLGVPVHLAQVEAVKMTHAATGVDFTPLLTHSPAQDNINEADMMLEPTELGKRFGLSAKEVNLRLAGAGLQNRINGDWVASELGKGKCAVHHWKSSGKSGYNLKWKVSAVRHLMGSVA